MYADLKPISILPVLSKILEKIMNLQIVEHLIIYYVTKVVKNILRTSE